MTFFSLWNNLLLLSPWNKILIYFLFVMFYIPTASTLSAPSHDPTHSFTKMPFQRWPIILLMGILYSLTLWCPNYLNSSSGYHILQSLRPICQLCFVYHTCTFTHIHIYTSTHIHKHTDTKYSGIVIWIKSVPLCSLDKHTTPHKAISSALIRLHTCFLLVSYII